MKTWTILICSYNCKKTIKDTLNSIVYKNNDDIDVFVVDDGSTEDIYPVVKPFIDQHPNIVHYFRKENGNQGSCVNFAVKHANSRFLSLLDSDDTFNKREFNNVLNSLRNIKKNTDLVILNYRMHFLNRKKKHISKCVLSTTSKDVLYKTFDEMSLFRIITIHGSIYSLKLLKRCDKIPEKIRYADNALYYQVLLRINNVAYLNKDIYLYNYFIRGNKQAIYLKNSIKTFDDMLRMYDYFLSIPLKSFGKKRHRVAKKIIGNHIYWILAIVGNNFNYSKDQKKEIIDEVYAKLDKYEKVNHVEGKITPGMIKVFQQYKYGGAFFVKFLYKFFPVNFIKATRLGRRDKKEFDKLDEERRKFDSRVKALSRRHEKLLTKLESKKAKEKALEKKRAAWRKKKIRKLREKKANI